jgi:N-acetylglucosamine kinase-like BadF-type ATPase
MYVLGVDGGNTKTIAVVADDAGGVASVEIGGCSDIYGAGSAEAGCEVLAMTVSRALLAAGLDSGAIAASALSLAGADWPEDVELLERFVATELGMHRPLVVNDAMGALRAGAPDWEGIAVVCGTFNAVGARHRDGTVFHIGFWPDRTGAFDLSTEALKAIYREGLDLGAPTALTSAALAMYGAADPIDLLHHFTRRGRAGPGEVVRMSPVLLDIADDGDEVATAIVVRAGRLLGEQARVSAARVHLPLSDTRVVMSGGVLSHPSALLADAIMDRLDGAVAVRPHVPPVAGAVLLALDRIGIVGDAATIAAQLPHHTVPLSRVDAGRPPV